MSQATITQSEPFIAFEWKGADFETCLRFAIKLNSGAFTSITRSEYKGAIDDITCALMDLGLDWNDLADVFETLVSS